MARAKISRVPSGDHRGAESRGPLVRRRGSTFCPRAGDRDEPDRGHVIVLVGVDGDLHERDLRTIGRDPGIGRPGEPHQVIGGDRTLCSLRPGGYGQCECQPAESRQGDQISASIASHTMSPSRKDRRWHSARQKARPPMIVQRHLVRRRVRAHPNQCVRPSPTHDPAQARRFEDACGTASLPCARQLGRRPRRRFIAVNSRRTWKLL